MPGHFTLLQTDSATAARRGRLATRHGVVDTPVFMPVGTQGTVKAVTPAHLREIGAQIILGNTYHLNLRPGSALIRDLGGLHAFMGWEGPILTDSGGFQVFSLAKLRRVRDEGITFQSHLDGATIFLGPREVMAIQQNLGSDIAMVLDECPPWPCERDVCARASQGLGQRLQPNFAVSGYEGHFILEQKCFRRHAKPSFSETTGA
jgi:queuine tRNA-ribosyltransferase